MISKLEKYAKFINMPLKDRIAFINEVKPEEMYRGPIPGANESFEEDNFVSHTVFDTKKPEEIYKIATYRENSSVGEPKAIVALFHGLMSHTNRGVNLAKYFAKRGITTIGMDYRGFGKS